MKKKLFYPALVILLAACLSAGLILTGCGGRQKRSVTSFEQFHEPGVKVGISFNLLEFKTFKEDYPEAEVIAYHDMQTGIQDVAKGRIDAYIYEREILDQAIQNGITGVTLLKESYSSNDVAVGLSPVSKIPDLENRINAFIAELREEGILDDMYRRWVISGEQTMPDIKPAEDPGYHLRVGTVGTIMPYSYYEGTELTGYDIELAYRFASWLGADLEFKTYDFSGILAAAATGDVDCIMSNLFHTTENDGTIPFSDTIFTVETTALVRIGGDTVTSPDDLAEGDIGVITGSNFPEHIKGRLPDANVVYYNTTADELYALNNGRIDAVALDEPVARNVLAQSDSFTVLTEKLADLDYGFIFEMSEGGEKLRDDFNGFLERIKADGTMEALQKKWFDAPDLDEVEMTDYRELPDPKGTIDLATITNPPFSFFRDGMACGYDIELFTLFCREYGRGLTVTDVNMDAILSTVQSGKYHTACCGISITEERKESMLFSLPVYSGGTVLVVRNSGADGDGNFFTSVAGSFEKTFIREDRWLLFLEGTGTTLLITALSVIFGTLLGFGVYMLCRKGNKIANAITRFFIWLIHGMPVVVLLMVLYYVIFGKVAVSGTVISVLGFTLIFGAAVFSMLKSGVGAIDKGQTEAALALGYTDRRSFFRVILPQALPHFMPAYKAEITSLMKATAVVGYVTVQDLTKMGDIVRSRTYEAFFPLIAVAVIYFLISALLIFIVKRIEIRIDPRRRTGKSILKGVNLR